MTPLEFDALASTPRHVLSVTAEHRHRAAAPGGSKRRNGQRQMPPVELLSARLFRLRIARGLSIYDLAAHADVSVSAVRRIEAGEPVDKRVLPALARALEVPLCRLVCGEHDCKQRACIPPASFAPQSRGRSGQSH